ncbi:MAG: hypothetical protein KDI05_15370 [Halieaceae bacterium]|nr:hypothetical protein [Halieaceae bacterium]MCP5203171.1 hypothetical protein [Pseudomonadales bacterium]
MKSDIIELSPDFWNIRGSFRIGGVVDIGTQASLVRLASGAFVLLDSYTLSPALRRRVDAIIGGSELEAIINLHPFHTVHVRSMHEAYPRARLYGTVRHHERFADLPWERELAEEAALHALYADDFDFSVPRGVDFVSANENIHFSSVLALHRASRTIHVDDTLMYMQMPLPLRLVGWKDTLVFHPTLPRVLEPRAGAAAEFRQWVAELIETWGGAENLCAAHATALLDADNRGASIAERITGALRRCEPKLRLHQRRYG